MDVVKKVMWVYLFLILILLFRSWLLDVLECPWTLYRVNIWGNDSTWPPNSFYFGQKCMKWKQFLLRRNSIQKLIGMQNGRYQLCANIYTMLQTPAAWWGTKDLFCSEHSSWGVFFSGHQEPLCHPITVEEGWDKYNKDQPSCPTCTIAKQWLKICRYVHATHRLTITSA